MIPSEDQAKALWDKYHLPNQKRVHSELIARVATDFANKLQTKGIVINVKLLRASALLHDIDKAVETLPGEKHPDAAVRILRHEGMEEVAAVVKTHPLHAIIDPAICPTTWEEKLLFLADKMVKYDIIGVDKRFALWREENLPPEAVAILDASYPRVKKLEEEIRNIIGE